MAFDSARAVTGRRTEGFAASGRENRAYAAALNAFQDAMWNRAETEFAQFTQKYPKSDRVAEAVLLQAEAEFKQGKISPSHRAAQDAQSEAGNLADQYVYWMGEAQFQKGDFSAAAETFVSLTRDFSRIIAAAPGGGGGGGGAGADQRVAAGGVVAGGNQQRVFCARRKWTRGMNWYRADNCCWRGQIRTKRFYRRGGGFGIAELADAPAGTGLAAGVFALSSQAGGGRRLRGTGGHDQSGSNRAARKKRRFARRKRGVARGCAGATGTKVRSHRGL